MRRSVLLLLLIAFGCAARLRADKLHGTVIIIPTNCPVSGLAVEVHPQKGSTQAPIITNTAADGTFAVQVIPGHYLLVILQQGTKVYQQEEDVSGDTLLPIVLNASGPTTGKSCVSPHVEHLGSYYQRPIDMAMDTNGNMLVLDKKGQVFRVITDRASPESERLFVLPSGYDPESIASNSSRIYVTSQKIIDCVLFVFDKESDQTTSRTFSNKDCTGIAVDDRGIYIAFGHDQEIEYWPNFDFSKPMRTSLPDLNGKHSVLRSINAQIALALDNGTQNLFVADTTGRVYKLVSGQKEKEISTGLGRITSLTLANDRILVAVNRQVYCLPRDLSSAKPMQGCLTFTGTGDVTGVRIDLQGQAWVLIGGQPSLLGPLPLSNGPQR